MLPNQPDDLPPDDTLHGEAQNLYASLLLLGLGKKANDVLECGHAFYAIYCHECATTSQIWLSCHLRLCPKCARRLARTFIARHHTALKAIKQPKLLTLTFRSTKRLTRDRITYYLKCLARLRHRKLWRDNVSGGLYGLELTWGAPGWHPHFHLLIDSNYIPRPLLIDHWKDIADGAWNIDIRQIRPEDGVDEVAKYVAKGWTFYNQPHLLAQYLEATKKRRFLNAFGTLYRSTDPPPPTRDIPINLDVKAPVESAQYGFSFMKRCHQCGSRHVESMGKAIDIQIVRPPVQIPF